MFVNCAHGKGIRFIRDELKFFAKSIIQSKNGTLFKSIVLFNSLLVGISPVPIDHIGS